MNESSATLRLNVTGMTCSACAARIEKALSRSAGIESAAVNFATEKADVAWDPDQLDSTGVLDVIRKAGFGVREERFTLAIKGMTCSACAARIEKVLHKLPGVISANVNFALESAAITVASGTSSLADISSAIERAGFTALRPEADSNEQDTDAAALASERRQLNIAAALTAPLILQMLLQYLGLAEFHLTPLAQAVLATPVQFVFGKRFYVAGYKAVRNGSANMDVLVVLGTSAAYFYSWYVLFRFGTNSMVGVYFEASAVIITLVLLGKYMESRAKRSTTEAIRQLMELRPSVATVIRAGVEQELPIDEVRTGDLVVIRPGANIPVDGVVTEGHSDVDESLITGESIPVTKQSGSEVTGGALNGTGRLLVEATAVGANSTLNKIIQLVENAQAGKAPVQRLVDKVSAVFVPVVIAIALCTFGLTWWYFADAPTGLIAAVSVLVIACPCALGLATPTAIMTGTGAAARAGILIRDVESLERAHQLNAVIFDKTGTLTEGRPEVTKVVGSAASADELLSLAAGVQQGSEHPLAGAILRYAEANDIQPAPAADYASHTGQGMQGRIGEHVVKVGKQSFAAAGGGANELARAAAGLEAEAQTVVWVGRDDTALGIIAIADKLRATSPAAIAALRKMDVRTLLLSGDAAAVATAIGAEAGVDEAVGGALPEDKAARVKELTAEGYLVGMIGDGINDAPALAAAHVGIAMGSGTDIAMETASITLMRSDPRLVPAAIDISRATWNKIRQNLFWAFFYNVIGIPLAALGYLSPTLAGAAMAFSSVSVVSNSLLLKRWHPKALDD